MPGRRDHRLESALKIAGCSKRLRRHSVGSGVIRKCASKRNESGLLVGVATHIIIGAVSTKHGDAPAAELQDEKGHGVECHCWEIGRQVVAISQLLLLYLSECERLIEIFGGVRQTATVSVSRSCYKRHFRIFQRCQWKASWW
jgi:hypothetical protein